MANLKTLIIDKFYGGIVKDDKSRIVGGVSNIEELDIFSNENFIQAEQIMSSDSLPAGTEAYAYTVDDADTIYTYGKETTGGKVRITSVANAGNDNPGTFSTAFTSSDSTNLATSVSPFQYHRTSEANNDQLYFIKGASATWYISRYNLDSASEERWTGSAWSSSGSWDSNSQLTGLVGSFDRPWMVRLFGELYIGHGQYVAHIDDAGTFTEKKFTLPNGWKGVSGVGLSDIMLILCKNDNRLINESMIYQWDLTRATQFDDSIVIPMGGPQWIVNHKEAIRVCCAINGEMRLFQLSGSFPVETHRLSNIGVETTTQAISQPKSVAQKQGILYFGLFKTDKSGVYALGQLDEGKSSALVLSKRFDTSNYSLHKPTALFIQGPNYYFAYVDNGTAEVSRCESNNSPDRSSNAVYESIWIDDGNALKNKFLTDLWLHTYPLSASTSLTVSIAKDYGSYTTITQEDAGNFNEANALIGYYIPKSFIDCKVFKIKIAFTSSTTNSPKLVQIGIKLSMADKETTKST